MVFLEKDRDFGMRGWVRVLLSLLGFTSFKKSDVPRQESPSHRPDSFDSENRSNWSLAVLISRFPGCIASLQSVRTRTIHLEEILPHIPSNLGLQSYPITRRAYGNCRLPASLDRSPLIQPTLVPSLRSWRAIRQKLCPTYHPWAFQSYCRLRSLGKRPSSSNTASVSSR